MKQTQALFVWLRAYLQRISGRIDALLGDVRPQGRNTIAVLDGVRALAIIFVIIYHINRINGDRLWAKRAYPLASTFETAGSSGVVLFFVLSGFLLFLPYAKALLAGSEWPSARTFYLRRVLRILPGYYISLFLMVILWQPQYLRPEHWYELFLFVVLFMDSTKATFRQLNGPFWTLAIEWQFYMLLPLLVLGIAFIVRKVPLHRRFSVLVGLLLAIIGAGLLIRFAGFYLLADPARTYFVPRSVTNVILFFGFGRIGKYIEVFALGMLISLCYVFAQRAGDGSSFVKRALKVSPWLWGAGILLLVFASMWHFSHEEKGWHSLYVLVPYYDWLGDFVTAIGYGSCVAALLFGPAAFKSPFAWRPLCWIGLVSYSLYIWHLPLMLLFKDQILPWLPHKNFYVSYAWQWLWLLLIIIPISAVVYVLIERPWIKLGDRKRYKALEAQKAAP